MVEVSDVPLTENIKQQRPRDFFPTLSEFASDGPNFEQVVYSAGLSGGPGTFVLKTVGENETLFITTMSVSGAETANVNSHGRVTIQIANAGFAFSGQPADLLEVLVDHTAGQHGGAGHLSITFPMPLKVPSGGIVQEKIAGLTNADTKATITGFIVPKKIS